MTIDMILHDTLAPHPPTFHFRFPENVNGELLRVDREPFGAPSLPEVLLAKSKRQPNQIVY
jgi:hypothetical protein